MKRFFDLRRYLPSSTVYKYFSNLSLKLSNSSLCFPNREKMKLELEVTSEELVKPSSPTPANLRRYKLSFLDQVTADVYNPMVYFYQLNRDSNFTKIQIKNHLKNTLSAVLSDYYPLAGRVNYADFVIDCNDDGIPFLETRVKFNLHDVVSRSFPEDLNCLVPFELDRLNEISMGVQLNFFECGGIGLGVCVSHKIADALSFFSVVNSWARAARGEAEAIGRPHLVAAKLFPPRNAAVYNTGNSIVRDRVARRFVIDGSKVEAIREKYAERAAMEGQRRPTKVEALSAFIYGRFLAAIEDESSAQTDRLFLVCHTVNIRQKLDPPLPQNAFGNYYRNAMTLPSAQTLADPNCCALVNEVRLQIAKINAEFLRQFQEENAQVEIIKATSARFAKGEIVSCAFTSLCRFPLYDADFGWGSPLWAASPALPFKNLVVFMDTKSGDGAVDAIVHLKESHMKRFEVDCEFLKFASPTAF
ncbi:stemmadenine O-acetyltransferase-like [Benincasa hispida]|uniref:stemmadenine O-acetyltransferase-like n=1 Tax=Benincasa hispida TaxID=102211 RepID=UPI0019007CD2|nr:stemmadenine O-acetyltransferase-like [Benincasa hispida]